MLRRVDVGARRRTDHRGVRFLAGRGSITSSAHSSDSPGGGRRVCPGSTHSIWSLSTAPLRSSRNCSCGWIGRYAVRNELETVQVRCRSCHQRFMRVDPNPGWSTPRAKRTGRKLRLLTETQERDRERREEHVAFTDERQPASWRWRRTCHGSAPLRNTGL
jgi:hypothetical protein